MFIIALFKTAKTWNQPNCPSTEEWIHKVWSMYTVEYYSTTKKSEILTFTTIWMDIEGITLNEMSEQEAHVLMILLLCGI